MDAWVCMRKVDSFEEGSDRGRNRGRTRDATNQLSVWGFDKISLVIYTYSQLVDLWPYLVSKSGNKAK